MLRSKIVRNPATPAAQNTASLTAHVSWLMCAKTIGFAFTVALPMVLVRRLDQAQFGVYKQLFLIITTSVMVLPLGFGMSAYYFLPREPARQRETVLNIQLYCLAVGCLVCAAFFVWPALLDVIFHQPGLTQYAHLTGCVILLLIFSQALEIVPIAHGETKVASAMIVGIQVTRTAIYLAAVLIFGSVKALVWSAVAQGVLQTAVLWWYLDSRFGRFWLHFDWPLMRSQISYAVPLGLAGILYTVQTDLHSYFVSNRLGPVAYAIYGVGIVQLPLMAMLQEATNAVVIPRVCGLQQHGEEHEIVQLLARAMRKLAAVYFPAFAVLFVTAREFVTFFFTPRYLPSVPVFRINLLLLLLGVLLLDPLFRAYVEQRFFLIRLRIVLCFLLIAALWIGIARFGLFGAIAAVVLVTASDRIVMAIRFGRILHVGWKDLPLLKDTGKLAVSAAAAAVVAESVRLLISSSRPIIVLATCGIAFGLVYSGAVWLSGALSKEEKDFVLRWLVQRTGGRLAEK